MKYKTFLILGLLAALPLCFADEKGKKEDWQPLFDGKTLKNWSVPAYGGEGKVAAKDGIIVLGRGDTMTGIRCEKKDFPKVNYEIRYEARRTQGSDFFAACTFPVQKSHCTFVNGGWGGSLTGLSSINHLDASENSSSSAYDYKDNIWYRFRILVTEKKILVWITELDKEKKGMEKQVIDCDTKDDTKDVEFSVRAEMSSYQPLGFCSWASEGELRNAEYRKVAP